MAIKFKKMIRYIVAISLFVLASCESGIEEPEPGNLPEADFIFQVQTTNGRAVSFASTSQDATSLIWDFGDNIGRSFAVSPTYTFAQNGTYSVRLTVGNKAGIDTKTVSITVEGPNDPIPNFDVSFTGVSSLLRVNLTNTSELGATYLWNFGDGQTSTIQNPGFHQYANSGTYQIELAVSNAAGTVTRRKRTTINVIDGSKILKTWKFRENPYFVSAYPVKGNGNSSLPYFVLRNGSLAYESMLLSCELNDRYSFAGTTYTNTNQGDGRVFESRNECKTIAAVAPATFEIRRSSLTSFVVDTGATYFGDLKAGPEGFVYDIVELSDTILVLSYLRADETNPALLERAVMVFQPE
jgi:PKD repeat protein